MCQLSFLWLSWSRNFNGVGKLTTYCTYSQVPNKRACSFTVFSDFSPPCSFIMQYITVNKNPYSFSYFSYFSPPARLLGPARLIGTWEYIMYIFYENLGWFVFCDKRELSNIEPIWYSFPLLKYRNEYLHWNLINIPKKISI